MRATHGERAVGVLLLIALIGLPIWHMLSSGELDAPPIALPDGIARPPHVALVSTDGVTIAWRTVRRVRGGVDVAREPEPGEPAPPWIRIAPDHIGRDHAVRVGGLAPATRYRYRVVVEGRPRGDVATFRTAPAPDATVRVALVGDSGSGSVRQRRVIDRLLALEPDLVIHTGDMAYNDATPVEVQHRFVVPFSRVRASIPLLATLGNHDLQTEGGRPILDAIVLPVNDATHDERFYRTTFGPLELVCIDTEAPPTPGTPQHAWLERVLAPTPDRWRVVFGHRPMFRGSRSNGSETLRAHVAPLLERHGVALYVSGHDHVYMRTYPMRAGEPVATDLDPDYDAPGAPIHLVTGGGGKSLYEIVDQPHIARGVAQDHVVLLVVSPARIEGSVHTPDGEVLDSFSLAR